MINMHGLHNATLIRKILPRHLTQPTLLYANREAHHYDIAAKLRVTQAARRAAAKMKRAATTKANLAKKAVAAGDAGDAVAGAVDSGSND